MAQKPTDAEHHTPVVVLRKIRKTTATLRMTKTTRHTIFLAEEANAVISSSHYTRARLVSLGADMQVTDAVLHAVLHLQ